MTNERPDPDELLARVKAVEEKQKRGKLKVFFGMAPGVGKTYAMLEAAHKVAKEGRDVIVGYIEPHVRPETQALVLGLDLLQRRTINYRDRTLTEFDLEAALARKPELILVDELAHTNAEGSTHPKRWQDIDDLLAAGIDVYTTLNVQHLESLNDVVAQVTTVPVRETVPDQVFEKADEVELVDIAPDDLIERMREGRVYLPDQAFRALENFFKKGNLIALRELSLRKTAERVSLQALNYRQEHAIFEVWPTSERLLVCVGPSPMSARLIRATRRMAAGLRAPWIALHVDLDSAAVPTSDDARRLEQHTRLAEELGARVCTVSGEKFAETVLKFARENNVTKIIVGKPLQSRLREWLRGAMVYDLIRECGTIDVYVISGDEEVPEETRRVTSDGRRKRLPYLWAAIGVMLATAISFVLAPHFELTNLVMIYLAVVVAISLRYGRGPSIFATVLSVAAFDLSFVPPRGTFAVADTQYLLTFAVMLLTGLVVSELAGRVNAQTNAARQRERNTAALYALTRELTNLPTREAVVHAARRIVGEALNADVWIVVRDSDRRLVSGDIDVDSSPPAKDQGVVQWVYDKRRPAGRGTDTLAGADACYLPLLVTGGIVGVVGIRPKDPAATTGIRQDSKVDAFVRQIASAIERCDLAREAERVRLQIETERLRNSLLSAVSHDLRTPLATISGATGLLAEKGGNLTPEARQTLLESTCDEAERLNRLVNNLLDLTKLEAGAIHPSRALQPIEEVIGIVLDRVEPRSNGVAIETSLPENLPPVPIDGLLVQQALMNILDNAIRFAPKGSKVEISVRQDDGDLVVEISDRGPGLRPGDEQRVFEKFYRASEQPGSGSGIGLTICRGIMDLHGGTVAASNRPGGGAVFRLSFPLGTMSKEYSLAAAISQEES
jgi:two-component system, OmpR family, sensor histidine kinase KdpD